MRLSRSASHLPTDVAQDTDAYAEAQFGAVSEMAVTSPRYKPVSNSFLKGCEMAKGAK